MATITNQNGLTISGGGASPGTDRIPPRRLVAFLAMVFGMFMAILDIQPR
jgi:DHA2 family multidrug resistance protein